MTDEEKNFNKWFDEYTPEKIYVFEEVDLKIAYLQGCADEVKKWERVNGELRLENAELKRDKEDLIFIRNQKAKCMCEDKEKLTKAKELLNEFMRISKASDEDFEHDYSELIAEAEQFLKECVK